MLNRFQFTSALCASAAMISSSGAFAADDINPSELLNLSLEQLSNIEVTSVSKRSEKASEAAAAIFVITQDDIKRSGATSIPEVLRIVPGLSVAQSNAYSWAISSRGATGQFANKLLVLIDGRSVYTPLYSGVFWDAQNTVMSDIDRIEVIRGPGATLWGANAVNGVINIITKNARDTQGGLASQTIGNQERSLTDLRYGMKFGQDNYVRAYAKYDDHNETYNFTGRSSGDQWNNGQGGFRADGSINKNLTYTLQGDAYRQGEDQIQNLPALNASLSTSSYGREINKGMNLLGRLNYRQSDTSNWTLQTYYDNVMRDNPLFFHDSRNTFDFDLQNDWIADARNEVVWGVGYRLVSDDSTGSRYLNLTPDSRSDNTFSAFIQDKFALVPNSFFLTLGSKFEHNDYSGFEMQPSARLTWLIDNKQTWWSSVSHAVHTPYRFSDDGSFALATTRLGPSTYGYINSVGNDKLKSERLNAFETGYRIQPTKTVSLDTAAFYNRYDRLITNSIGAPQLISFAGGTPYYIVPVAPINGNKAHSYGLEIAANWEATNYWKLAASYSWLSFKREKPDQLGFTQANAAPPNQANLRSTLLLPHNLELDNSFYYVDGLVHKGIPAYVRVDARLAWKALDNLELSLVGQNIFDHAHPEFSAFTFQNPTQIPRSVYGNITWKF